MSLYEKRFRDLMDLKIFVMTDDDIRLSRRIQRDIAQRGRTIEDVLQQYNRFVKPSYDEFIKPVMKYADIIIPHGRSNTVAIDFVLQNLKQKLDGKISEQTSRKMTGSSFKSEREGTVTQQIKVVFSSDDKVKQQSQALLKKLSNEDEELLFNIYSEALVKMTYELRITNERSAPLHQETSLFVADSVSSLGVQSLIDFVDHAPVNKTLEIFTIASTQKNIDLLTSTFEQTQKNVNLHVLKLVSGDSELAEIE